tara:strand:- start:738 stop:1001 length:264 start_codon:yes stop_codon:yes gene_type:complete
MSNERVQYKFDCKTDTPNPDFPCDIQLQETVYQQTEVFPFKVEDSFQLEYGYSDYLDSEGHIYYCRTCNQEFNYEEVLELIVVDEEE